jgi:hypothetical protein
MNIEVLSKTWTIYVNLAAFYLPEVLGRVLAVKLEGDRESLKTQAGSELQARFGALPVCGAWCGLSH